MTTRPVSRRGELLRLLAALLLVFATFGSLPARAIDILSENFDELPLQNVQTFQSEVRGRHVWTNAVPSGAGVEGAWSIDNSAMPPETASNLIGVAEFEGWTFVDRDWWIDTAGDQGRSGFVSASGTIAVADPDEWDDFGSPQSPTSYGHFDSTMRVSNIQLLGAAPNTVKLFFHSSWRFEGIQKASLTVKYNDQDNTSIPLFLWDSNQAGPIPSNFKGDATNESVSINALNPAGATEATLEFRLFDAGNNWWWAIDNLNMFTGAAPAQDGVLRLVVNRDNGQVRILNNTPATVNLRGYSLTSQVGAFNEAAATFLGNNNPNWQVFNNPATSDLSEGYIPDQYAMPTQTANPALGVINLGNSWQKYFQDTSDVTFQYLVAGKTDPVSGIVEFIGNGGQSFDPLDLNFDGAISLPDYAAFLAGYNTSLTGKTGAQQYNLGDLNHDGKHSVQDYLEFKRQFDQLRGPGALDAAIAAAGAVPEPTSIALAGCVIALTAASMRRRAKHLVVVAAIMCLGVGADRATAGLPLLTETFDELTFGQSPEQDPTSFGVWTDVAPAGWTVDRSAVPGYTAGDPANDGVKDFAGWTFASRDWWVTAAGDQHRTQFTRSTGGVMIADDDTWDDAAHPKDGYFNSYVTTPPIVIPNGVPAGKVKLAFDSSWRPEGFDDWILPGQSEPTNNQTATVEVSYNNGASYVPVLTWDSQAGGPNFKADATNEGVEFNLNYNGAASTVKLRFGLTKAANDWWWAVDNVRVFVPANPTILEINTTTGVAKIKAGDVIAETLNGYDVTSANGNLAPTGNLGMSFTKPDPLDGPDLDAIVGSTLGENWQLAAANANQFSEFFLDGSSNFVGSRTESLGRVFNPATPIGSRDVLFTYTTTFGDVVPGVVQYVTTPVTTDFDGNTIVDGADLLRIQRGLGTTRTAADLANWEPEFGLGYSTPVAAAIPEPTSVALCSFALAMLAVQRRKLRPRQGSVALAGATIIVAALAAQSEAQVIPAPFVDRDYRMGDADPGAANGVAVGTTPTTPTRDSAGAPGMNQLIHLLGQTKAGGPPQYVTVSGRPDGGTGLGIRLNPNPTDKQFLKTGADEALNYPTRSPSSTDGTLPGGTIDYNFITDRGFQLWVQPFASTEGQIVMDSNNHGVMINSAGKFTMRYSNADYPGLTSPTPNQWYHLMVVRAFGDRGTGSVLYVNGVAESAATGIYFGEDKPNDEVAPANQDNSPLVVGSTTAEIPALVGGQKYFRGVVDDLAMFVMGFNAAADYGEFQFQRDNKYASFFAPTTEGDLNNDHLITMTDVTTFASNWRYAKTLTWTQGGTSRSLVVGDLTTRMKGDFNYDGRVNLADWGILNAVNPAMGTAAASLIGAVPEPTSVVLAATALFVLRRRPWQQKVGCRPPLHA